ncbi:MAG TPA: hypothetical protein VFA10_18030 [Ktedonobacteraceae bacterium]|nr:hypothetical protein [Ktedonobacteraceae bacterium]
MAFLYTKRDIEQALREERIKPQNGMVNTKEAARILSWRAKFEYDVKHDYPESVVRQHVARKNLKVAEKPNKRLNLFRVEEVFEVPLSPKRGTGEQHKEKEAA